MQVALGDAYGGERRRVVAMYRLPAPGAPGKLDLGALVVRWASTIGNVAFHTVTIPVTIEASDDPSAADAVPDAGVVEQVNILRSLRERKAAHERLTGGDIEGAKSTP